MRPGITMVSILLSSVTGFAAPSVNSVTYAQNPDTKAVTVTYVLSGDAGIPILDIRTNNVSIGWANLRFAAGDVHQVVQPGSRKIVWNPDKAWPGHSLASGVTAVVRVYPTDNPPDLLVVNCGKGYAGLNSAVQYYASEDQLPEGTVNCAAYKTDKKMAFRKIPAQGIVWRMGRDSLKHKVKLTSNYYMGVFEVTQSQYQRFMGSNPSTFTTDSAMCPVDGPSWNSIRGSTSVWPGTSRSQAYGSVASGSFMYALREHAPDCKFDLPTEAQWEFACRAGSGADYPDGSGWTSGEKSNAFLETHARYQNNAGSPATPAVVGTYLPNRWGLYDMHGNMFEWGLDHIDTYDTTEDVTVDPVGVSDSESKRVSGRITRGGSFLLNSSYARSDSRYDVGDRSDSSRHFGFRVCIPLDWNK